MAVEESKFKVGDRVRLVGVPNTTGVLFGTIEAIHIKESMYYKKRLHRILWDSGVDFPSGTSHWSDDFIVPANQPLDRDPKEIFVEGKTSEYDMTVDVSQRPWKPRKAGDPPYEVQTEVSAESLGGGMFLMSAKRKKVPKQ